MSRAPILWLYGADAVGKSTVAWEIYDRVTERGGRAAYVDTDYLGFCSSATGDRTGELVAANLAAMWPNFASAGATCLVVAGVVTSAGQRRLYDGAIPSSQSTFCRLRARPETQAERILRRASAEGYGTEGAVSGLSAERLGEYAASSARFARALEQDDFGDFAVDTDDENVPALAQAVLRQAGPAWREFCD